MFLEVRPFEDGNGRLLRILTTLLLLRADSVSVPYSSMESIGEQNEETCYLALRRTQGTIRTDSPDWTPWLEFFLATLQRQMQRLRTRVERERLMIGSLPDLSARILDLVREQGRLTIGDAARVTGVSRNTLKQHLRRLVEDGHLRLHGADRGAWYARR